MGLFNKKDKDGGGEDSSRLALFGNRSKSKSPAPSSSNPYAQAPAANPYAQAKAHAYEESPAGTLSGSTSRVGLPSGPAPSRTGPTPSRPGGNPYADSSGGCYEGNNSYGGRGKEDGGYGGRGASDTKPPGGNPYSGSSSGYGASSSGYGANPYGGQSGYGGDRYGSAKPAPPASSTASQYGAGGYGSYGASQGDQADDEGRNALFGDAKERVQQRQKTDGGYGPPPPAYDSGTTGGGDPQGYGSGPAYGDRQLTAEEEEEEDVKATKQQIRMMKQSDVSSTRNALRMAQQAEESGRDTLARLGAQGEMMHETNKNLDLAHNQNKAAEEKAKELKTLNRSMFAVHVSNPFTASSRDRKRDQDVIDKHLDEKERREETRRQAYESDQRMQRNFTQLDKQTTTTTNKGKNLAERAKYQFEEDSEDDEMENEIDSNLDALGNATGRLHSLAKVTGEEVDRQNKLLDDIHSRSDRVDIGLASNRARIDRIGK